jgi:hypothetical protein
VVPHDSCLPTWVFVMCCSKEVRTYLNTNIYFYLETSGGQSSNPYLNIAHFLTPVLIRHLCQLKTVVFLHWCHMFFFFSRMPHPLWLKPSWKASTNSPSSVCQLRPSRDTTCHTRARCLKPWRPLLSCTDLDLEDNVLVCFLLLFLFLALVNFSA